MPTDDTNDVADNGRLSIPFEAGVAIFVLTVSLSQYSIGAVFDKTGEQIRGGLPLVTLILFIGTVVVVFKRRKISAPVPSWWHIAFLVAASLGLLGLNSPDLKSGVKEVIQIAEIFGLSWYLFASCKRDSIDHILKGMGIIGIVIALTGIGRIYQYPPFELSHARWGGLMLAALPFIVYTFRDRQRFLAGLLVLIAIVNGVFHNNGGLLLGLSLLLPICVFFLARPAILFGCSASLLMLILSLALPGRSASAWDTLDPAYDATYKKRLFVEYSASLKAPAYYPAGGGVGHYKQTINVVKQYLDEDISPDENKIPRDSNSQYLLTVVESGIPAGIALALMIGAVAVSCFKAPSGAGAEAAAVGLAALGLLYAGAFTTTLGRGIGLWTGAILGLAVSLRPGSVSDLKESLTRFSLPVGCFLVTAGVMVGFNKPQDTPDQLSRMNQRLRGVLPFTEPYIVPDPPQPTLKIFKAGGQTEAVNNVAVHIEGEDFDTVVEPLKASPVNHARGGKALIIPLNSGKARGAAEYTISIPEDGTYRVHVQVYWEDGCSNSIRFVSSAGKQLFASERFKEWHSLVSRKTFELSAGEHRVSFENTEDGVKLDYFELVREPETD